MNNSKRLLAAAISTLLAAPAVYATNGMNMEGYGPIATGTGGASMAYDNGTAAVMNNPATLGLMEEGNRLDVALGKLGPDVDASAMGQDWPSEADAFYMPALGWAKRKGNLTYGVAAFAQGGMGTEYDATAPGAGFVFATTPLGGGLSPTSGIAAGVADWDEMSEVGVMRIILPLSYNVDDKLTVGGSLDYVRASMDLKMVMTGGMLQNMMTPGQQTIGKLSGSMVDQMGQMMSLGILNGVYGAQFDFADSSPYSGETSGDGFAGKLGFTYQVNDQLTVGGTYHSQTSLSDLTGDATANMAVNMGGTDMIVPVAGKVKVKNFQWPETYGVGLSYKANDKLMIAADVKQIKWSDAMKNFEMSFTSTDPSFFTGTTMNAIMFQDWDDQTVFQAGAAYKVKPALTIRGGFNIAKNPIPDSALHYLFPAIVENHYTAGVGYELTNGGELNFALVYAPEVTQTNDMGMEISHSQTNWQFMYSHRF